jgi:hypothetical protein
MTGLTESCYSHTDLEPLNTDIARIKKMDVLVLNKVGRVEVIGQPAETTEIQFDHHLIPLLHVAIRARIACTLTVQIAARNIRVSTLFHSI